MASRNLELSQETRPQEQTPAELLIDKLVRSLGSSYFIESNVRILNLSYDKQRKYAYKEVRIKKQGKLGSRRNFLGASPFITLFADGGFVREIELNDKGQDKTPPQNIEGWTMGDGGFKLALEGPRRDSVPQSIREKLDTAGVSYFATVQRYLYRDDKTSTLATITNSI